MLIFCWFSADFLRKIGGGKKNEEKLGRKNGKNEAKKKNAPKTAFLGRFPAGFFFCSEFLGKYHFFSKYYPSSALFSQPIFCCVYQVKIFHTSASPKTLKRHFFCILFSDKKQSPKKSAGFLVVFRGFLGGFWWFLQTPVIDPKWKTRDNIIIIIILD